MGKIKQYRYETVLFLVDAISMIIELVASRLLSPYFGNTYIVWTSVIGIILLSSSIGNYYGGKIADGMNVKSKMKNILYLTTASILIIPFAQDFLLKDISFSPNNIIGVILTTSVLFFIPSLLMGVLTPIVVKLKLENIETAGTTHGRINAIATIGGITGTFLGGFFLIPTFGCLEIVFILSIILALTTFLIDFSFKDIKTVIFSIIIIIISIVSIVLFTASNTENKNVIMDNITDVKVSIDTQYGRAIIYNEETEDGLIRRLNVDGGFESATFVDKDKRNELVYNYTKFYDLMFESEKEINNVLMIGGAGYSYPKYFISHFENKKMDVVEIDGDITKIAKKYFYLDELIEEYNIKENKRLRLFTEDGRIYLNNNKIQYDAILNDAFSSTTPAKTLTTLEAAQQIKKSLSKNGLYLSNVASSLKGKNSRFLKAEVNTLKQVFANVYIIPTVTNADEYKSMNIMVIATDDVLSLENTYNLTLEDNEIIITDNYCPIDTLTN